MQGAYTPILRLSLVAVIAIVIVVAPRESHGKDDSVCHPALDPDYTHYMIGYGSLMNHASKQRTWKDTGENRPVRVRGIERGWSARGRDFGFSTTFLGATSKADAEIVAALFRIRNLEDVAAGDAREYIYCRQLVAPSQITMLDGSELPPNSKVWIYILKPDSDQPADDRFPIIQSYIDLFLNGCIQLAPRVVDKDLDFLAACIETTQGWPVHWVNDRVHPRRPVRYPNAAQIDATLKRMLPEQFNAIRIE